MKEQIKKLRKFLKMNQTEFGAKIGVKQSSVAAYENGARIPLDTVINSICREFHVNEQWLRTGEGEMYSQSDTFSLDKFCEERGASALEIKILKAYFSLGEDTRREFMAHFERYFGAPVSAQPAPPVAETVIPASQTGEPEDDETPLTEAEIEAMVADYRALLKKGRAVRLALGHGMPPRTKVSGGMSSNGAGGTGSFGDDIA